MGEGGWGVWGLGLVGGLGIVMPEVGLDGFCIMTSFSNGYFPSSCCQIWVWEYPTLYREAGS